MISEWSLSDFKSFRHKTDIPFAPLTIFCGSNSSGKSTVLQSILLIKQTLEHSSIDTAISLNGPLVRLGAFGDVLNFESGKRNVGKISFAWTLDFNINPNAEASSRYNNKLAPTPPKKVGCCFSFSATGKSETGEQLQLHPRLEESKIFSIRDDDENNEYHSYLHLSRARRKRTRLEYDSIAPNVAEAGLTYLVRDLDESSRAQALERRLSADIVGCAVQQFLPRNILVRVDQGRETAERITNTICRERRVPLRTRTGEGNFPLSDPLKSFLLELISAESSKTLFDTELDGSPFEDLTVRKFLELLRKVGVRTRRHAMNSLIENRNTIFNYLFSELGSDFTIDSSFIDLIRENNIFQRDFFLSLRYLGPLRDSPKPLYSLQPLSDHLDVGTMGEHTAAVLHMNQRHLVTYVPSESLINGFSSLDTETRPLHDAVADWLNYLGVAEDLITSDQGKFGHAMQVRSAGSRQLHDLTNVGVGGSQVLLIISLCLLAEPGQTLVFEQPELHLHPTVQARLADFFLACALQGKQCIIETHGEYIIERLRYRIAEAKEDNLNEKIKIYFMERREGVTNCNPVTVSKYGAIEDWPTDFFDQSQKEREKIIIKAIEKKRNEDGP